MKWKRFIGLLLLSCAVASGQDETNPNVRRFLNVVDWSLQTGMAKRHLLAVIRKRAAKFEVPDVGRDRLLEAVPGMLIDFRLEKAKEWSAQQGSSNQPDRESSLLRISSVVIEDSLTFRTFLRQHVGRDKARTWLAASMKENARIIRVFEIESQRRKVRQKYTQAATIAIRYHQRAIGAIGSFRRAQMPEWTGRYAARTEDAVDQAIAASRDAFRLSLQDSMLKISHACVLKPAQERRLEIAMKGMLARRYRKAEQLAEDLMSPDLEDFEATLKKFESAMDFDDVDQAFWKRAVDRTLTTEQKAMLKPSEPAR